MHDGIDNIDRGTQAHKSCLFDTSCAFLQRSFPRRRSGSYTCTTAKKDIFNRVSSISWAAAQIAALLSHLNLPEITWSSIVLHHFSSALLISTSHQHFSSALPTFCYHCLDSQNVWLHRVQWAAMRRTWLATVLKYSRNDQSGLLTSTNPEIDWLGWFSWISIAVCHSLRVTHPLLINRGDQSVFDTSFI